MSLKIGDRVVHCMGHRGVVLRLEGVVAVVRFANTVSRVFVRDLSHEHEEDCRLHAWADDGGRVSYDA